MTIVYQTKLCFQLCKQIRLSSISAAVKLSSALGFVPFVHSSVGLGCSRIYYTIRKDKRALLLNSDIWHLPFLLLFLYTIYTCLADECIAFANPFVFL